jgi:hypothetical protein
MTTLVFVHGTGVRQASFDQTFKQIQEQLRQRRQDITAQPCLWGQEYGAQLRQNGDSIPDYQATGGGATRGATDEQSVSPAQYDRALWSLLYQDPLFELRTMASAPAARQELPPGRTAPNETLRTRAQRLAPEAALKDRIDAAGIGDVFDTARNNVVNSEPFRDALRTSPPDITPYIIAVARAIVAEAIAQHTRQGVYPPIATDADLRDAIVQALAAELGRDILVSSRGAVEWASKQLLGLAYHLGAVGLVERSRGVITDSTYPAAGDIMLYQSRGDKIRDYIRSCIATAARSDPSVVVLAHSLGGIACVDLLAAQAIPAVKLLVTAGSQAPLFYEIGALSSLEYQQPLPEHFPEWLNIFDKHDFLSYIAAKLFPGRATDVEVDSRQPFPYSHGAYWANRATWDAILPKLP